MPSRLALRARSLCCTLAARARGGTSHIAPPNMNSYIKKYEFIYPVTYEFIHPYEFIYPMTYEFIHPAKCMNSYVSDSCLVYNQNGHLRWRLGGGWCDRNYCYHKLVPGSNPQNLDNFFLANLANFHVATILANLYIYKPNI